MTTRDLPRYVALYRGGRLPVDRLMTGRLKLEDINQGLDRLHDGTAVRQVAKSSSSTEEIGITTEFQPGTALPMAEWFTQWTGTAAKAGPGRAGRGAIVGSRFRSAYLSSLVATDVAPQSQHRQRYQRQTGRARECVEKPYTSVQKGRHSCRSTQDCSSGSVQRGLSDAITTDCFR